MKDNNIVVKQAKSKIDWDLWIDLFWENLKWINADWSDIEIFRTETVFKIWEWKDMRIAPVIWVNDIDELQDFVIIAIKKPKEKTKEKSVIQKIIWFFN